MKALWECQTFEDCRAFFVRDCLRRAAVIEAKIERGLIEPHNIAWAKAKAETYRAEAAEEMNHG